VQGCIAVAGAKTTYIERGSRWQNGYIESFNARLRDHANTNETFFHGSMHRAGTMSRTLQIIKKLVREALEKDL
jgi:Integrase core domain